MFLYDLRSWIFFCWACLCCTQQQSTSTDLGSAGESMRDPFSVTSFRLLSSNIQNFDSGLPGREDCGHFLTFHIWNVAIEITKICVHILHCSIHSRKAVNTAQHLFVRRKLSCLCLTTVSDSERHELSGRPTSGGWIAYWDAASRCWRKLSFEIIDRKSVV